MAHYYSTDWVEATPVTGPSTKHVSWGPAIGITAAILGICLIVAVFLGGGGAVGSPEDAVVYIEATDGHGHGAGGTGMVINTKQGWVLTNRHVAFMLEKSQKPATNYKITLYRGTDHEKTVDAIFKEADTAVASDSTSDPDPLAHDWAVLEIKGDNPRTAVHFADSLAIVKGTKVKAWGFPAEAKGLETKGVKQKDGTVDGTDQVKPGAPYKWIQHSASLAEGNSGGPLTLEKSGRVIGMNTAGKMAGKTSNCTVVPGTGNQNYAIPTHVLKPVLDRYAMYKY